MYQLQDDTILRLADNASIPKDAGNRDYEAYLAWVAEGNTAEPVPEVELTLAEAKTAKLLEIRAACNDALDAVTGDYPHNEIASWQRQYDESKAYQLDSDTTTIILDGIAAGRGIEKADLVEKILANADAFAAYSSRIIGRRQALEEQVDSAEVVGEVKAVSVEFGV